MLSPTTEPSERIAPADENQVSKQLRMLMSPKLVKAEWQTAPPASGTPDPQLTYRPPATIESFGAKPAEAPISAATFKKSESPLQAVVATVGSMAILAALYHFGYYEGAQTAPEPRQYTAAASAPLPVAPPPLPDPFPAQPEPELVEEPTVASVAPVLEPSPTSALEAAPATPKPTPVPVPAPPPAASAPSGLYLQVAALKDSAAARELERELRTAGFETEILDRSDDGLIRVISGPYDERNEARIAARKMSGWGVKPFLRTF